MGRDRDRERHRAERDKKHVCAGCKNFKAGSGAHGVCQRTGNKRDADEKSCGHYDPR